MFDVIFTPRAEAQLIASYLYLRRQAPQAAANWLNRIQTAINTLDTTPERCPVSPDSERAGYEMRELLFGKRQSTFRILFAIRGNVVFVLFIRRASRGPIPADEF